MEYPAGYSGRRDMPPGLSAAILADALVVVHVLAILFIVFGGLLALRWPRAAILHLPALAWGIVIEVTGWICPLTPWEQQLRRIAGEAGYSGGFAEHYLLPLFYPAGLTPGVQYLLAASLLVFNAAVYAFVYRYRRR